MNQYPRRPSYGIFVRFRRSRLALRRGISRLEDALQIADALRVSRFHDRGDIFVVKEPEGTIVAPAPQPGHPLTTEGTPGDAVTMGPSPPSPVTPETCPENPAPPGRGPSPAAEDVPQLPSSIARIAHVEWALLSARAVEDERAKVERLVAQLGRTRRAIARARAAQERFEGAFAAVESAIRRHGGRPPDALRRHQERLHASRESTERTVASCERMAALLEARIEAARVEARIFDPAASRPAGAPP
jgi:hypothetical protein